MSQIVKNEIWGQGARMAEGRTAHRVLVGEMRGKNQLGIHTCKWDDNTKLCLLETG